MTLLLLGLAIFFAIHGHAMMREHRAAMIERYGKNAYRALHSIGSVVGLALMIYGFGAYRASAWVDVWHPPLPVRHIALSLNIATFVLLAATFLKGWISAKARHPTTLAVIIWSAAHLFANGDLGSMLLFGAFLVWGVAAWLSMERRPEEAIAAVPAFGRNDVIAVLTGLAAYAAMIFWLHRWLIGVSVLP